MNEHEQPGGQPPSPSAKEPKVIKRYTNRKLYDTVESRYVTLDEIAEMIKQGVEVRIVDNRSKEDLTSVTLAQIIFEEEKKKNQMPLAVLREIIRHPGESISGFIQKEVSPRVASIREEAGRLLRREDKDGAEGEEPAAAAAGAPANAGDLIKASQRALEEWQKKIDDRARDVVENVLGSLPALGRDMQNLVSRIETLEKRLEEIEKQRK